MGNEHIESYCTESDTIHIFILKTKHFIADRYHGQVFIIGLEPDSLRYIILDLLSRLLLLVLLF